MKILLPVALCVFAGLCNIPYLLGFRKAYSANPFLYSGVFNLVVGAVMLGMAFIYGRIEAGWFPQHKLSVLFSALGIIIINITAYFVINRYGASWTMVTSLTATVVPPAVVGFLIFREKFNGWIVPALVCAVLAVVFFALSKRGVTG